MNSFFNDDVAVVLQHVAVPIEMLGLSLALIEGIVPDATKRLEAWIDRAKIQDFYSHKLNHPSRDYIMEFLYGLSKLGLFLWIGSMVFCVVFSGIAPQTTNLVFGFINEHLLQILKFFGLIVLLLLIGLFSLIVEGILEAAAWILERLEPFTHGKTVGLIGILLASLGLCTEIYQVATMYLGPNGGSDTVLESVTRLVFFWKT